MRFVECVTVMSDAGDFLGTIEGEQFRPAEGIVMGEAVLLEISRRIGRMSFERRTTAGVEVTTEAAPSAADANAQNYEIENSYWRFDAKRKGLARWRGMPMSERDAFKSEMLRVVRP